jgi:Flp pilus assembly protein TadG
MKHVQCDMNSNTSKTVGKNKSTTRRPFGASARGWKRFIKNTAGNMSIMFAASVVPLIGFAGVAVEYTQYSRVRTNMLEALDSAGLAISQKALEQGYDTANLTTQQKSFLKKFGRDFFETNFTNLGMIQGYSLDFVITPTTVTPQVQGTMNTGMLRVLGFNSFNMSADTEITLAGTGKLELALVLDVTGSMNWCPSSSSYSTCSGTKRIDVLDTAVDNMLDTLIGTSSTAVNEDVKIGIIPFNAQVNVGATNAGVTTWMDTNAESYYHGYNFVHMVGKDDVDFDTKVNHFNLFDSNSDMDWKGCVEARPYPLDEFDTVAGAATLSSLINSYGSNPLSGSEMEPTTASFINSAFSDAPTPLLSTTELIKSENSKFVPFFWPDEPESGWRDCDTGTYYYIFDCPNDEGWSSSYSNSEFIDDSDYVSSSSSYYSSWTYHTRYRDLVRHFRANISNAVGGSESYPLVNDPDVLQYATRLEWDMSGDWYDEEFRLRQAYVGQWDSSSQTYKGKYDTGVDLWNYSNGLQGYGPNTDCNAPIQPLTSARVNLDTAMAALRPHGSTNTSVGAIWGWRVLSDIAPFSEGVDPSTTEGGKWSKAMVLMTDGSNTFSDYDTHNFSYYTPYGYGNQNRLNLNYDDDRSHGVRDYDIDNRHAEEFDNKTVRVCARMRAEGIKIYTVGFAISSGSRAEQMLQACASSLDDYYLAENSDQLQSAFTSITDNLVNLYVSQ